MQIFLEVALPLDLLFHTFLEPVFPHFPRTCFSTPSWKLLFHVKASTHARQQHSVQRNIRMACRSIACISAVLTSCKFTLSPQVHPQPSALLSAGRL